MCNNLTCTHSELKQSRSALNTAKADSQCIQTQKTKLTDRAQAALTKLRSDIASLKGQVSDLECELGSCRHKLLRRDSCPPSDLGSCYAPSQTLCPDSPISGGQDSGQESDTADQPCLLSRMAAEPVPALYTPPPPRVDLPLSTPVSGAALVSHLSDLAASAPTHPPTTTAFYKSVGLYSLL